VHQLRGFVFQRLAGARSEIYIFVYIYTEMEMRGGNWNECQDFFPNKIKECQDGEEGVERGCNNFHGCALNTVGMCCTRYLCRSSGPRENNGGRKDFSIILSTSND
jgi:hypothetical protein